MSWWYEKFLHSIPSVKTQGNFCFPRWALMEMGRNYRRQGKDTHFNDAVTMQLSSEVPFSWRIVLKPSFQAPKIKPEYWFSGAAATNYRKRGGFNENTFILLALWTRNLKSRRPLGSASSEGTRRASFVCSSFCSGHPWHSAASLQSLILSSHVSFSLLSLLSLILYLVRHLSLDSKPTQLLSSWES